MAYTGSGRKYLIRVNARCSCGYPVTRTTTAAHPDSWVQVTCGRCKAFWMTSPEEHAVVKGYGG